MSLPLQFIGPCPSYQGKFIIVTVVGSFARIWAIVTKTM